MITQRWEGKRIPSEHTQITRRYFNDIRKYEDSDPHAEQEQFEQIHQGDMRVREKVITSHMKLVVNIARQYASPWIGIDDLIQEGNIGLCKAIEKFDEKKGNRFSALAAKYIQGYILQYIDKYKRIVAFPMNQEKKILLKIETLQDDFIKKYGHLASSLYLSQLCGELYDICISPEKIDTFLLYNQAHISLNGWDILDEDSYKEVTKHIYNDSLKEDISRVLTTLTTREGEVIMHTYGIERPCLELEEIGEKYGLVRDRVRQIKEKAIRRMQNTSRSKTLKEYLSTQ